MKHVYWGLREENMCKAWVESNPRNEYKAYEDLKPKLNLMSYYIIQRYFSVPSSKQKEVIENVVEICLLKLKEKFDDNKKTKYFSFCQRVIKNALLDELVFRYPNNRKLNQEAIKIDDVIVGHDNNDLHFADIIPNSDIEYNTYDELILSRFNELKIKLNKDIARNENPSKRDIIMHNNMRIYIDDCIEYMSRFDVNKVDYISMNEYIERKNDFSEWTMNRCTTYFFGIKCMPRRFDKKDEYRIKTRRVSEAMSFKKEYDYINDDYCPNDGYRKRIRQRKITKKKFDENQYF